MSIASPVVAAGLVAAAAANSVELTSDPADSIPTEPVHTLSDSSLKALLAMCFIQGYESKVLKARRRDMEMLGYEHAALIVARRPWVEEDAKDQEEAAAAPPASALILPPS